jgi:ankyrin repeat protein
LQRRSLACLAALMMGLSLTPWSHAGPVEDFFKAVKLDDTKQVVNLLFRGFDPNTLNEKGLSGLMVAAREGSLKVAQLLLSQNKTQVELRSPGDENALMFAALAGHTQLCKMLIEKSADVNKTGWTPLHYAATKGQVDIIRLLREHHAYIDAESPNKSTPLMLAAMYGTVEAVKFLIEEGADVSLKNDQNLTALDFAKQANRPDMTALLQKAMPPPPPPPVKSSW